MSPQSEWPLLLDEKALHALAVRFNPIVRFHEAERFFPVLAESWLTHTTQAAWDADPLHALGDLPPDAHRRGMALLRQQGADATVLAGPTLAPGRPLQLSDDPEDPWAVGQRRYRELDGDAFLDLAGWQPGSGRTQGDIERLYALFSELSAAVNQSLDWTPLQGRDDLPHAWIPQPVNPTTYCEARAAGDFAAIGERYKQTDFAPGDALVGGYLALTYHYLYPAREPFEGEGPRLEGQWEAATLFLPARGLVKHSAEPFVLGPPEYVVVSQNVEQTAGDLHHTALRGWSQVEKLGEHPVLYAGRGSHKFFFEPVGGTTGTSPVPPANPGADPGAHEDDFHEGALNDFLFLALILLAIAAIILLFLLAIGIAVFIALVLIVLAIILLFEWLMSLFADDNDDTGSEVPGSGGNEEAGEGGPQGGGEEEPAGPAPDPGGGSGGGGSGGGGGTVGLPNTGSPTGRATVSFDVRLIDRVLDPDAEAPPTGFPADRLTENPSWWDFSGRWGVRVADPITANWRHGTRRVDEHRRSWGYWNALRLSTVLHGGAEQG